jgi:hypothetical protein
VAKTVARPNNTKIVTPELNLKGQNINTKPVLKPSKTYNKPCFEIVI